MIQDKPQQKSGGYAQRQHCSYTLNDPLDIFVFDSINDLKLSQLQCLLYSKSKEGLRISCPINQDAIQLIKKVNETINPF